MSSSDCLWLPAPSTLALSTDVVHVWCAVLDRPTIQVHEFLQTLSHHERKRAEAYHFARDRTSYIVRRGILRAILARYLSTEPETICFSYGRFGKPYLTECSKRTASSIEFNLAHSYGLAVYAFARNRRVGVDVERVRDVPDAEQIAARFFSAQEYESLLALPKHKGPRAFLSFWTRKEAYLKAIGHGLSYPLRHIEVSRAPGEPSQFKKMKDNSPEPIRWSVKSLAPSPRYVAALVVEGDLRHFQQWHYVA